MADKVIVKDQNVLGGEAVFRGTRVPFQALLDYLEHGKTLQAFLDQFPSVTREGAIAALEEAKIQNTSAEGPRHPGALHGKLHVGAEFFEALSAEEWPSDL